MAVDFGKRFLCVCGIFNYADFILHVEKSRNFTDKERTNGYQTHTKEDPYQDIDSSSTSSVKAFAVRLKAME